MLLTRLHSPRPPSALGGRPRRQPAWRWLLALALCWLVCGCSREQGAGRAAGETVELVTYHDFVVSGDLAAGDRAPAAQRFCGDENYFTLALGPGERRTFRAPARAEESRLVVSGCRRGDAYAEPDGTSPGLEVRLRVGEEERREVLPAHRREIWWRQELEAPGGAGQDLEIEIFSHLEHGPPILLRDLYLEQHARAAPIATRPGPQILLISLDTLRAGSLGRDLAPEQRPYLHRFLGESRSYPAHFATAIWTRPSHASMLTGRLPREIGAHRGAIDTDTPTVAERLAAAGLSTGALVHDCHWLDPRFGFDRGFASYASQPWDAPLQVRQAVGWLLAHRSRPFFYFLHLFDAHSDFDRLPYEASGVNRRTVQRDFGLVRYGCRNQACASALLHDLDSGKTAPLRREDEVLAFLYRRGVADLDAALDRLFGDLIAAGLWEDLMVVVTSDHGENLLEDGRALHAYPSRDVVRVPLEIKWPRDQAPAPLEARPTTALDLTPTLLGRAGIAAPELGGWDLGRVPTEATRRRTLVIDSQPPSVVEGRFRAIFDDRRPALYDLETDPRESTNLLPAESARFEAMLGRFRHSSRGEEEAPPGTIGSDEAAGLSAAERARLESLGYL